MSSTDELIKRIQNFKKKRFSLPLVLIITIVLSTALLIYMWYYLCFVSVIIALAIYAVPKYFGLTNLRKLALFGIIVFLIMGIVFGVKTYYDFIGYGGDVVGSEDGLLVNGTVSPFRGNATTIYHFSITVVNGTNDSTVQLNVTDLWTSGTPLLVYMSPYAETDEGYVFVSDLTLWEGVFEYQFSCGDTSTYWGFGPLSIPDDVLFQQLLISRLLVVFLQIGLLFYLVILLVWWMDISKARRDQLKKEKDGASKSSEEHKEEQVTEKGKVAEKFVCSECGAEVPPDAKKCPQCGEPFEEEEKRICSECGAEIKSSDTKCWNCGKVFDAK